MVKVYEIFGEKTQEATRRRKKKVWCNLPVTNWYEQAVLEFDEMK